MEDRIFIRLDGDSIGDSIELALINGDIQEAQRIHTIVQTGLKRLVDMIRSKPGTVLLLVGCDDILFSTIDKTYYLTLLDEIRTEFYQNTMFTLSIGVGLTLSSALINLTRAKLSGKNRIINDDGTSIV